MSSTYCKDCGEVIFQETFDRNRGRCTRCFKLKHDTGVNLRVEGRPVKIGEQVYSLLKESEAHCVIDCCGLNAIEISSDSVNRWKAGRNDEDWRKLVAEYEKMKTQILESEVPVECLNDLYTPKEALSYFSPIEEYS